MVGIKSFTWSWCSVEGSRASLLIWVIKWDQNQVWFKWFEASCTNLWCWAGCLPQKPGKGFAHIVWQKYQHLRTLKCLSPWGQWMLSKPCMSTSLWLSWLSFCIIWWCTWNSRNLDVRETWNSRWNLHIKAFSMDSTFEII